MNTTTQRPLRIAITGVSRGLGLALSQALAARGHQVFGCQLSADAAPAAQANPALFSASVAVPEDMRRFAEAACREGAMDIVVCNAGVINARKPAWEISQEEWAQVMEVNVLGVVNTLHAFLPAMLDRGQGLFVAISSGWGRSASWGLGPYCASKFAVEGLIGSLSADLPEGLHAVALDPGNGVNTKMLAQCLPDDHTQYIAPGLWAEHAADYIVDQLHGQKLSGSRTVPHPGC
ncbi:SDR family oxidoreductase [Pseudomonas entomophila]|uniref:SDR family oxidoreductase n=1 Tax=Pseudomonas entomophila TaxID=312306 RepID=UPI001F02FAE9|nr:SDR family NAD(P)-dependent oxidoreductase [Pseudomonas entomophila]MCG8296025.1 SDR family NAD(P)-dependent oxidoreductase [Pseudomonas entomophila]